MATTAIPGFSGLLYASTALATTAAQSTTPVAELEDVTLTLDMTAIPATSKDSAGWDEFLAGIRKWTLAGKGYYHDVVGTSSGATGQSYLEMSILGQTKMGVTFRATSSSGIMNWGGGGLVTKFAVVNPLDKANEYDFAFQGSGAIFQVPSTS